VTHRAIQVSSSDACLSVVLPLDGAPAVEDGSGKGRGGDSPMANFILLHFVQATDIPLAEEPYYYIRLI